jgi:hypothetical protein
MKLIKQVLLIVIICFGTMALMNAKERQVTGIVSDDKKVPIAGVRITVKNSLVATVTDLDGSYSIIATETDTLGFSATGFDTKQVVVGQYTVINVTLTETLTRLSADVMIKKQNFMSYPK